MTNRKLPESEVKLAPSRHTDVAEVQDKMSLAQAKVAAFPRSAAMDKGVYGGLGDPLSEALQILSDWLKAVELNEQAIIRLSRTSNNVDSKAWQELGQVNLLALLPVIRLIRGPRPVWVTAFQKANFSPHLTFRLPSWTFAHPTTIISVLTLH